MNIVNEGISHELLLLTGTVRGEGKMRELVSSYDDGG